MSTLTARLGLPSARGHVPVVTALVVDALGTGMFLPVSLLYFTVTTPLSLAQVGLGLSVAATLRLPLGPVLGALTDRLGPRVVLLLANLVQALGFVAYLGVRSLPTLILASLVVQAGDTAFWSSYPALVTEISAPGERERWFGFLGALRNTGFALGGLLSGVAVSLGGEGGYRAVVVVNAVTFGVATLLLALERTPRHAPAPAPPDDGGPGPWRTVLADRPYLGLSLVNVAVATSTYALTVVMPVWAVTTLGLPAWVPGVAFTINCLLVALAQGPVVALMTGRTSRVRALQVACALAAASSLVLLAAGSVPAWAGVALVLAGVVVFTAAELVESPLMATLSAEGAPEHLRGRYLAAYQVSWNLSGIIGPAALTALLALGGLPVWGALVLLALVSGWGLGLVARHLPAAREPVGSAGVPVATDPASGVVD